MDLEKNSFLGSNLGISSIPTFLFIHKGQVVKKQSGADQNALTANIKWLISTYNLGASTPGAAIGGINHPAVQPEQPKTVQVYTEKSQPFYFDTEKWDLPIKKLKEHGTKNGLFDKPEFKDTEKSLVLAFNNVDAEGKRNVVEYALKSAPVDDLDNLVPFMDFFRICLMRPDIAQ